MDGSRQAHALLLSSRQPGAGSGRRAGITHAYRPPVGGYGENVDVRERPVTLFLCGDVMSGRGVDQVLPHPGEPRLWERYVRDARTYVEPAVNGPIPRPVDFAWPWGDAIRVLDDLAPDVRLIKLVTGITRSDDVAASKAVHYRMTPERTATTCACSTSPWWRPTPAGCSGCAWRRCRPAPDAPAPRLERRHRTPGQRPQQGQPPLRNTGRPRRRWDAPPAYRTPVIHRLRSAYPAALRHDGIQSAHRQTPVSRRRGRIGSCRGVPPTWEAAVGYQVLAGITMAVHLACAAARRLCVGRSSKPRVSGD